MIVAMKRWGPMVFVGLFLLGHCALSIAADAAPSAGASKQSASVGGAAKAQDAASNGMSTTNAATPSDAATEFRRLFEQWQSTLADVARAQVQINPHVTTAEGREAIFQEYGAAAARANALEIQLQAAAEKAFVAGNRDPEIGQLLFTMAVANIRKDNYEEALRLAKLLIDGKYADKDVYRLAASSAFATMQLDEAKKCLESLGDGRVPAEPDLETLAAEIEHYRLAWERERKRRQAESKAGDLPRVKLKTSRGDIVVELFENDAPNTVANFISLVEKGIYDNTQFHRVLPGFMAQGGDPLSKDPVQNKDNIGKGVPGYTIVDEFKLPGHRDHFRGTLSMAHTAQPNSAGSQFFIMFAPTPSLDGVYTAFGRVVEGMEVLSKLQRIDPDKEHDRPSGVQPDKIVKAEVLRKRDHSYEPKTIPQK
jgi:cyclophilin family peptidyl-prolyl cis-trans isomerase